MFVTRSPSCPGHTSFMVQCDPCPTDLPTVDLLPRTLKAGPRNPPANISDPGGSPQGHLDLGLSSYFITTQNIHTLCLVCIYTWQGSLPEPALLLLFLLLLYFLQVLQDEVVQVF